MAVEWMALSLLCSLKCASINGVVPVQGYDVAQKCITFTVVPFRVEVGKCACACMCVRTRAHALLVTLARWCVTQHIATFCIPVMSLMIQQTLKSLILIFPVIFQCLLTFSSSCTSWTFSFRMFGFSACWLYLIVSTLVCDVWQLGTVMYLCHMCFLQTICHCYFDIGALFQLHKHVLECCIMRCQLSWLDSMLSTALLTRHW